MKKHIIVATLLPLLVIALAGVSQAGQREMDPYGLLQYRTAFITFTGVTDWGYSLDQFNTVDIFADYYDLTGDGEEKDTADHALKFLQTDKVRIEWSTGNGVAVLFDI
jgi:hypothetical protein